MIQKGISSILIILIIVGILVVGGGIWYWQSQKVEPLPTTEETADWKTYRNEKYGFEFKYPQELTTKNIGFERLATESDDFVGVVKKIKDLKLDFDEFSVFSVESQLAPESFDTYIKSQPYYEMDECYYNAKYFKDEPINLIIDKIGKSSKPSSFCLFIQKNKYLFKFSMGVYGDKEDDELFYKILSTFKFIGTAIARNCNDYEMPMSEEQIRECICPEGYIKFDRLNGAYCATDSRKPCSAHVDCPRGEQCVSSDKKNWFCTGRFAGCYYRNPKNPEEPMLCAD